MVQLVFEDSQKTLENSEGKDQQHHRCHIYRVSKYSKKNEHTVFVPTDLDLQRFPKSERLSLIGCQRSILICHDNPNC